MNQLYNFKRRYEILFSSFIIFEETTTSCATPNGETGNCIALPQCPSLYSTTFLTLAQREQIQLHQCGDTSNPQNTFVICNKNHPEIMTQNSEIENEN